jgi:hypothetical protein
MNANNPIFGDTQPTYASAPVDDFFAAVTPPEYASPERALMEAMRISLKEHDICMTMPPGSKLDAVKLDLPGGIVIYGAMRGTVNCARGSFIVAEGGYFQGSAIADNLIIEGEVSSPVDADGKVIAQSFTTLETHPHLDAEGRQTNAGVAAFSSHSKILAKIKAHAFRVSNGAEMTRAVLQTLY